jgi:hypothetical protein
VGIYHGYVVFDGIPIAFRGRRRKFAIGFSNPLISGISSHSLKTKAWFYHGESYGTLLNPSRATIVAAAVRGCHSDFLLLLFIPSQFLPGSSKASGGFCFFLLSLRFCFLLELLSWGAGEIHKCQGRNTSIGQFGDWSAVKSRPSPFFFNVSLLLLTVRGWRPCQVVF